MSRAATVPTETDLLCERCGYTLNGLPPDARCPECGQPAAESASARREPPAWERAEDPQNRVLRWVDTTSAVLFRPTRFFRSLATRPTGPAAKRFAQIHWLITSVLVGVVGYLHLNWSYTLGPPRTLAVPWWVLPLLIAGTYAFIASLTRLAARLTTWEATYRGYRLPLPVVMRGLHYHAPHYLPVAVAALLTVAGYQTFLWYSDRPAANSGVIYLSVLSGVVVVTALYLFKTYWTAMRNMMYANK